MTTVHLVGIGGSGMSGLARLLIADGFRVSGSDIVDSHELSSLRALGARIAVGHDLELVRQAEQLIFSPAVPIHDADLLAARSNELQIRPRAEALAMHLRHRRVACVTGSHGKTTTTAMLAYVLCRAGRDPGFLIGAATPSLGNTKAHAAAGETFVLEACEAFGALAYWHPQHCIVTNVDNEHAEHYGGEERMRAAFAAMVCRTPDDGIVAMCGDDPGARAIIAAVPREVLTFGLGRDNDLRADVERLDAHTSAAKVFLRGEQLGTMALRVAGAHNVVNALGAMAIALELGVPFAEVADALADFVGVERRWQHIGTARRIACYDDFAHHPTEVAVTLEQARRTTAPTGRVVAVFRPSPHNAQRLAPDFARALSAADDVLLVSNEDAVAAALDDACVPYQRLRDRTAVTAAAIATLRGGDVFVTIGSGEVGTIASQVLIHLSEEAPEQSIVHGAVTAPPQSLLARFLELATTQPTALAAADKETLMTYGELARAVRTVAATLTAGGIGRDDVVAISLPPSIDRIVAFLGVLTAGAVYLPIDPDLPQQRADFMIEQSGARRLLKEIDLTACNLRGIDEPVTLPRDRDRAYIIYTSGSTGMPKGVVVEHGALDNLAATEARAFGITAASRVAQIAAFGFDQAIDTMVYTIYGGGCLVFAANAAVGVPLGRFIDSAHITHLELTPSRLATVPYRDYPSLTSIIVGGEACPGDLVDRWAPGRSFINAYGPAEATVCATIAHCVAGEPVTIGRPIDNVSLYILDETFAPVPRGALGEIWIGGRGLAREYLRTADQTAERFRTLSLPDGERRLYRTGDLARMLADGATQFSGRSDDQVKLRGYRIELGEIEAVLRTQNAVDDAIVCVEKNATGAHLIAYVVYRAVIDASAESQLRAALLGKLPRYMQPDAIVPIREIPLDANGKCDRAALAAQAPAAQTSVPLAPRGLVEAAVCDYVANEFGVRRAFGVREDLDDLGLDSLAIAKFFAWIERHFDVILPEEFFTHASTVECLALAINDALKQGDARSASPLSLAAEISRKQLYYVAAWKGERRSPTGLLRTLHGAGKLRPLFWCFQGAQEHQALADELGPEQPLHGMRSGHLVFSYKEHSIAALATLYAEEMLSMHPSGPFIIGGNCQGGIIARSVACALIDRGRDVELLILLDEGTLKEYPGRVALFFGAESDLNPLLGGADADHLFRDRYPFGYTVAITPGGHGEYFQAPNCESLGRAISALLQPCAS
ncbi:MAG TPA: UDP-N-acetylmuramate--L-alanine ligase [Candidatus Baltobacteraceae bacterium]